MAGGELIIFLAVNNDMIDAEFKLEPRSLSNTMHGLEYLEKTVDSVGPIPPLRSLLHSNTPHVRAVACSSNTPSKV